MTIAHKKMRLVDGPTENQGVSRRVHTKQGQQMGPENERLVDAPTGNKRLMGPQKTRGQQTGPQKTIGWQAGPQETRGLWACRKEGQQTGPQNKRLEGNPKKRGQQAGPKKTRGWQTTHRKQEADRRAHRNTFVTKIQWLALCSQRFECSRLLMSTVLTVIKGLNSVATGKPHRSQIVLQR